MIKQWVIGAFRAQLGLILLGFLLPVGCASRSVSVEIPRDHPAHPDAAETTYAPPPNPFMFDIFQLDPDSPELSHGRGDSEGGRLKDSEVGTGHKMMKGPSSESEGRPHERSPEHQHKEHR